MNALENAALKPHVWNYNIHSEHGLNNFILSEDGTFLAVTTVGIYSCFIDRNEISDVRSYFEPDGRRMLHSLRAMDYSAYDPQETKKRISEAICQLNSSKKAIEWELFQMSNLDDSEGYAKWFGRTSLPHASRFASYTDHRDDGVFTDIIYPAFYEMLQQELWKEGVFEH